jgi:hypothetical protein
MTVVTPDLATGTGLSEDADLTVVQPDLAVGVGQAGGLMWPPCLNTTDASFCVPGYNTFFKHTCGLPNQHLGPHICQNDQYAWTAGCANADGDGIDIHMAIPQPWSCSGVARAGQCTINP